jgi:hypothetical protein
MHDPYMSHEEITSNLSLETKLIDEHELAVTKLPKKENPVDVSPGKTQLIQLLHPGLLLSQGVQVSQGIDEQDVIDA